MKIVKPCHRCDSTHQCALDARDGQFYCLDCTRKRSVSFVQDTPFYKRPKAHLSTVAKYAGRYTVFVIFKGARRRITSTCLRKITHARRNIERQFTVKGIEVYS